MNRAGLGRNDRCVCGSGKKYKKCCYPRTLPDLSKPNGGIPPVPEQQAAIHRALARLAAQEPRGDGTIANVDVGRSRVNCAPIPPAGDGIALGGTLAPPTPAQVEAKYKAIRAANPEGATEVVVTYSYPEPSGFAEVRMVFDADDFVRLVDGRIVHVLDLFRGMQIKMANGISGTILGNPERRYEIPIPPLPEEDGLWSSRVTARVKHTSYEILEFRSVYVP